MKLGIDVREIQNGIFTGIGRPLMDFIRFCEQSGSDISVSLFSEKKLPFIFTERVTNIVLPPRSLTFFWDQFDLPDAIRRARCDIFYSPYYKIPVRCPCKIVSAILDLMYLVYPPYVNQMNPLKRLYYMTVGKYFAHKATAIWTSSQHSKLDIIRLYKIRPEQISVIPLSVADDYFFDVPSAEIEKVRFEFKLQNPYLLFIGNFKPHKNISNLLRAFKELSMEYKDLDLVLVGPYSHNYHIMKTHIREWALDKRVRFTGPLKDIATQRALYHGARVFVFPSLYEGFGIPPVEAMACGVPVVASNATSIPEVVGTDAMLVDASRSQELARGIRDILKNDSLREDLIRRGKIRAEQFRSSKISQRLLDSFEAIL